MSRAAPRICFVSSMHPPLDKRVFDKEARSLAAAGFEVAHLCPDDGDGTRVVDGVQIVTYARARGKLSRFLGLGRLFSAARTIDADAYHCNEPDSWLVGVALRLFSRRLVVFDCHEHYPGQVRRWLPWPMRGIGAFACRVYLQLLGLCTHMLVLAKKSVADDLSWSRNRHVLVLNTAPLSAIGGGQGAAGLAERPPGGPGDPFVFVHLGVIRRERGSEQMLDAMRHLEGWQCSDQRLLIIGEFKDGSEQDFFDQARAAGIAERIEFHRWMPYEEAFAHVAAADVGLVLFQKDVANNVLGLPHKMFDYMLGGLPVIAPDFAPEIAEIIRDADCGRLLDTADTEALARTMRELMEDRAGTRALGARGRAAVIDRYNWENEAAKLIDAYREQFARRGLESP